MHLAPVVGWRRAAKAITRRSVSDRVCLPLERGGKIPVLKDDGRPPYHNLLAK